ncbi:hypothetical protein S40285_08792 [Stachybotrys chlorohalonatus IBT 40285]|uniref:Transcription factor domain-containing protein n=1 Tax=Stachybotrys chlorohalonatus (strain IBT 40285) TaxID=1283841 RepID=A0A084QQF7_STAC4|nr:hypothetical protein S40285_08792 [Stachybotrys chlorohalonata IBT 40285]
MQGPTSPLRCVSAGHKCTKNYKFKFARHRLYDRSQKWSQTPNRIRFVQELGTDEDPDLPEDLYFFLRDADESIPTDVTALGFPGGKAAPLHDVAHDHDGMNERSPLRAIVEGGFLETFELRPASVQQRRLQPQDRNPQEYDHDKGLFRQNETIRANAYIEKPTWPTCSRDEAVLFRHYVQKLSIWLDLCDPQSHFEKSVPSRAGTCPILLNAIFALSARHLAHTSRYDSLASNRYHEQCLNYLIPLLDHAVTISDENLFAATIILRVLEEMDVPSLGHDAHGHLLGIHAFVAPLPVEHPHSSLPTSSCNLMSDSSPWLTTSSPSPLPAPPPPPPHRLLPRSLPTACFWVGLRQEIYSAVMNQQSVRMNLAHEGIVDRSTTPADDFTWGNRAIVHCADVLNFCFGTNAEAGDATRWEKLEHANREWKACLPDSYTPVFRRDREDEVERDNNNEKEADITSAFPEIWYWKGCHVIATQHHILAELYLALFNPSHPRTGLGRPAAEATLSLRACALVRNLCGIGVCNQWCPPAMFTACMGIAAAGDRFQDRRDQDALLQVLRITERDHARPTRAVRAQLRQCWGWKG